MEAAKEALARANCVYILGYGFDENNSKLLELSKLLRLDGSRKAVLFTNYGNINRVNKNASRVFFGRVENQLLAPGGVGSRQP